MCADPRPALPVPPLAPFATDRIPEANFRAQEQSMVGVHHERQVRGKHLAISQHDQVEIGKSGREPARHTARQHNRVRTGGNQLARFSRATSASPADGSTTAELWRTAGGQNSARFSILESSLSIFDPPEPRLSADRRTVATKERPRPAHLRAERGRSGLFSCLGAGCGGRAAAC